ncbi:MAG: carbamoyltransferase N-terminal domain-containing protein [Planctomycetota bacterium]
MYILGLSFYYHDAAAALLKDGVPVAAAAEERFSRIKHDNGYPKLAIEFCLRQAGIKAQDLDFVVFYEKPLLKFERILSTAFATFPRSWKVFRESMHTWLTKKLWLKSQIREHLKLPQSKLLFADHHMSHAASAFFASPFEEAAILTVDGAGEWTTATWGVGKGNRIDLKKEMRFPHSVGLLYSAFTAYCGFEVNEGEYKLMGMAPYGQPRFVDKIHQVIKIGNDGSLWHDMDHFAYHWSPDTTLSKRFIELMGRPPRDRKFEDKSLDPFYCDMAASIQKVTEEILIKMASHIQRETGLKKLCIAGGVGLNCVANYKILQATSFDEMYVPPGPGDDGGALGAALWATNGLLGQPRRWVMEHAHYGSEYGDAEIETFLRKHDISFEKIDDDDKFYTRVAEYLVDGKVCGWFRGRFEWGPRALGARSIIADASKGEMKDIVNAKIKFREAFRPFAPSVLVDRTAEFFDIEEPERHYPTRFMLYVTQVRPEKRDKLAAITHVDGSGRLQAVWEETNAPYYRMIKRFAEGTGIPAILNTSFNLKGEPIVESPAHAFNTFSRSGMDLLFLRNYIVTKEAKKIIDTKFALRHEGSSVAGMVS